MARDNVCMVSANFPLRDRSALVYLSPFTTSPWHSQEGPGRGPLRLSAKRATQGLEGGSFGWVSACQASVRTQVQPPETAGKAGHRTREMAQQLRAYMFNACPTAGGHLRPSPTASDSPLPGMLASGDQMPLTPLGFCTHRQVPTHRHVKKNIYF